MVDLKGLTCIVPVALVPFAVEPRHSESDSRSPPRNVTGNMSVGIAHLALLIHSDAG